VPTDATAVGVLARSLPRRTVTVLRAESLVNDGTALGDRVHPRRR
jgi:monovalent cation/hydrogen antiporter